MSCLYWVIPLILLVVFLVMNAFLHINKTVRLDVLERQRDTQERVNEFNKVVGERLARDLNDTNEILRRVLKVDVATRWAIYDPAVWGQSGMPYIIMEKKPSPAMPIPAKKEKTK